MFDEQFKIVEKAVKRADASVSIESQNNNSIGLELIYEALNRAKNNGSFFEELVKLEKEKKSELEQKEEMSYGKR